MNIWNSMIAMTVIDIIILVGAVLVMTVFFRNRKLIKTLQLNKVIMTILFGLTVISLVYFVDLYAMWIAPLYMPMKQAMMLMENLHRHYSWLLTVMGFSTLTIGLSVLLHKLLPKLSYQFERRKQNELVLQSEKEHLQNTVSERTLSLQGMNKNLEKEIEAREEIERALGYSENKYKELFECSADAILIIEDGIFVDCNDATVKMLGYKSRSELLMTHPSVLSPPNQPDNRLSSEKADEMIALAFKNGSHRFEWDHKKASGEVFPVEVLLTAIPEKNKKILYVVWRDISDRKKAEAEVKYRAYYDMLTGLPNRQYLYDRLQEAVSFCNRHQHRGALIFLDVDRFKTINDSLGHAVGDGLLRAIAKSLKKHFRTEDIISRLGGDEFVVLASPLDTNETSDLAAAKAVAERAIKAFAEPFKINSQELKVTSSIGIALFPNESETLEDIVQHADTAMYCAKARGPNHYDYYLPNMEEAAIKRLNMEKDLRRALERQELFLCYQPQVNQNGVIKGVEALIRWQHPSQGLIDPLEFIPVAEDTGLIYPIGQWVLEQAIVDIQIINKQLPTNNQIHLSVNVSPVQFRQKHFFSEISDILERLHVCPGFLTLEITENIVIENLKETSNTIARLKGLGVGTSLDDFGTGYSSLSYLRQLPICELKIDKAFVQDIEVDEKSATLVNLIMTMAHQFGFQLVAEGVESKAQLDFMVERKCQTYQGFYFSKPLNMEQLQEYLTYLEPHQDATKLQV